MEQPYLSIVVPVYNEEFNLAPLMERLYPVVKATGRTFEILFTNDGSRDRSLEILRTMVEEYPGVKVLEFTPRPAPEPAQKTARILVKPLPALTH